MVGVLPEAILFVDFLAFPVALPDFGVNLAIFLEISPTSELFGADLDFLAETFLPMTLALPEEPRSPFNLERAPLPFSATKMASISRVAVLPSLYYQELKELPLAKETIPAPTLDFLEASGRESPLMEVLTADVRHLWV